jgi:hypothetical protein
MQNAIDAVRELDAWCKVHGKNASSLDLPEQDADVLIEFIKREDGTWFMRVRDKGIGMTGDTLKNYFLRAGASFRQSADWAKEFLNDDDKPRVLRAGRFGVGAFAAFLLGPTFRLWTRHAAAPSSMSYILEASNDSQLIEIRRAEGLQIGTTIEVELTDESVAALELDEKKYSEYKGPGNKTDWFSWNWPKVIRRIVRGPEPEVVAPKYATALHEENPGTEWALIRPIGFDAVYWTFVKVPGLVCNGLKIATERMSDARIGWPKNAQLKSPNIAVFDSAANLPLTTQRYSLSQKAVPFINELTRDVTLSYIAHALICGPSSRDEALSTYALHPLSPPRIPEISHVDDDQPLSMGCLRWCVTLDGMVPADPWLYSLLGATSCLVYGAIVREEWGTSPYIPLLDQTSLATTAKPNCAMLYWHMSFSRSYYDDLDHYLSRAAESSNNILEELVRHGINALGHQTTASNIVVLANREFDLETCQEHFSLFHENEEDKPVDWQKTVDIRASWQRFEAQHGNFASNIALEPLIDKIRDATANDTSGGELPDVLFVAEIQTAPAPRSAETMLAQIWNECLGAQIIPFDPDARNAMIEHGRQHPELKRHIEVWEEMKRAGSKWAHLSHDD